MTYQLRCDYSKNCVPGEPIVMAQGRGPGVDTEETVAEFEARFDAAVEAAKGPEGFDEPGDCPPD